MVNAGPRNRGSHSLNVETFPVRLRVSTATGEPHACGPQVLASFALTAAFVLATASSAFAADDGAWTVSKSSGEVWLTSTGAQPASLKQEEFLKPGDTIRTGRNGRVLLKRGEETMLISPNSVIGVPAEKKEGLSTTIVQQAGSILLEVEKRNVKHFEVETPYLAAVVKGTQFRVTVNAVKHQRRRDPRPGRGRGFQDRPDRAGDAGPACDDLRARQGRSFAERIRHASARSSRASRARLRSNASRCRAPASPRRATPRSDSRQAGRRPCRQAFAAAGRRGARQAGRDPDLVVDRRSQAERPQGHPRPRPRQVIGERPAPGTPPTRTRSGVHPARPIRPATAPAMSATPVRQRRKQRQHQQRQHEQRQCGRRLDKRIQRDLHRRDRDRRRNKRQRQ